MAKSTQAQTTANPALTPDGRPMFDTLGRSNENKRGPKAAAAAVSTPAVTEDGRAMFDSMGRSNVNKRGPKAKASV